MPLVIIAGHPCVGKTQYAEQFKRHLEEKGCENVILVNEESISILKSEGYKNAANEKSTRGGLKSAVDHSMSGSGWVIIDSMNYIKGFRYELYCIARTLKSPHCCVHVKCDERVSTVWNENRAGEDAYSIETLVDLRRRFEEPNERNRWDRPLFRVDTTPAEERSLRANSGNELKADAAVIVEEEEVTSSFRRKVSDGASVASSMSSFKRKNTTVAAGLTTKLVFNRLDELQTQTAQADDAELNSAESSFDRIYDALSNAEAVVPNSSTVAVAKGTADLLQELGIVSQGIMLDITAHQSGPDAIEGAPLILPAYGRSLALHRLVGLPELQRHRMQFVRLNSKSPPADETLIGSAFIDFLAAQI